MFEVWTEEPNGNELFLGEFDSMEEAMEVAEFNKDDTDNPTWIVTEDEVINF